MAEEAKNITMRGQNGEEIRITEREMSIMKDIIYNGELNSGHINPAILAVIEEETAPYFAGDKSAQEVAHIIQSRVEIILEE
jgi:multiple sugar transport system substrate-binding protein